MLIDQPGQDQAGSVLLLTRLVQILSQHRVHQRGDLPSFDAARARVLRAGVRNWRTQSRWTRGNPADPMAQLAAVLLALFDQVERTYLIERAADARSIAVANGRQVGRPVTVTPAQVAYAEKPHGRKFAG